MKAGVWWFTCSPMCFKLNWQMELFLHRMTNRRERESEQRGPYILRDAKQAETNTETTRTYYWIISGNRNFWQVSIIRSTINSRTGCPLLYVLFFLTLAPVSAQHCTRQSVMEEGGIVSHDRNTELEKQHIKIGSFFVLNRWVMY